MFLGTPGGREAGRSTRGAAEPTGRCRGAGAGWVRGNGGGQGGGGSPCSASRRPASPDQRVIYTVLECQPLFDSSDMTITEWVQIAQTIEVAEGADWAGPGRGWVWAGLRGGPPWPMLQKLSPLLSGWDLPAWPETWESPRMAASGKCWVLGHISAARLLRLFPSASRERAGRAVSTFLVRKCPGQLSR